MTFTAISLEEVIESSKYKVLNHGYIRCVEFWGGGDTKTSNECGIIEAARQSTQKSFQGWGKPHSESCKEHEETIGGCHPLCEHSVGDEKLLKHLYVNHHNTPFEFCGATFEIQGPIFMFREWHRHRTQSYNEMSARYAPLPDLNYIPTVERLMMNSKTNKQAGTIKDAEELTVENAENIRKQLKAHYETSQALYELFLQWGTPKELARVHLPVGRYSRMRASTNLRNWLQFMTLRSEKNPNAQWEIRQYANALGKILEVLFPKTMELFNGS